PVPTAEIPQWAETKLARHGVGVHTVDVLAEGRVRLARQRDAHPIVVLFVRGEVIDEGAYRDALQRGIGKGKAFGIGMVRECVGT
ncbi:MAG TPA: type I-E CRISPR-associated protein Cas6/Cse3/CasE, partial [Beutenbergiaceae bacterium]|nr:type I-E CRISPR-associated protein Cas6/Cse3/CasE [Beutenbergiaceae bacterium]